MYPVTQDFLDKIKAEKRQVSAKAEISYTDPFIDQSINIAVSEKANVSYPEQTADAVDTVPYKWASLDGSWVLDGSYHLAPAPELLSQYQFGWWGSQLSGSDGTFVSPYPTLTVTHFARPIHTLTVVGDSARNEYPVDFTIDLYAAGGTKLYTKSVTGNTQVNWSYALPSPVLDVTKQVLTITKWNMPNRQVKITEFFTSIQETYLNDDIVKIDLLEEREASQGSLPVGNISANEVTLTLVNNNNKFSVDNTQSPLNNLLKPNRRIRLWLGLKGDGDGVNVQQTVDFNQGTLNNLVVVNNKLQLPSVAAPSFSRNSIAYLSNGTLVNTNLPRLETGKFGKAIMVEEGTSNLFGIYSYNGDPANIVFYPESLATGVIWTNCWDNTQKAYIGGHNLTVYRIKTKNIDLGQTYPAGTKITLSWKHRGYFWFLVANYSLDGSSFTYFGNGSIAVGGDATFNGLESGYGLHLYINGINPEHTGQPQLLLDKWYNIVITYTLPADARYINLTYDFYNAYQANNNTGVLGYIHQPQLEVKPYSTSFIDGTRSPETLTIPTAGVLNPQEGTIEFWVKPLIVANYNNFFDMNISTGRFLLFFESNGRVWWDFGTSNSGYSPSNTAIANQWMNIVMRWSATIGTRELFINGQFIFSKPFIPPSSFPATVSVVNNYSAYIDDLRISSIARSDEEIAAAYASGQPLPVDEWTTYKLGFDGNLNFGQGGSYISSEYDLSAVGTAATSAISWQEDPDGIQRTVYAKLDNQADWTQVVNGGKLPVSAGDVLTGRKLQLKSKLLKVV